MELLSFEEFSQMSENDKYKLHKDILFKQDTSRKYEWENIVEKCEEGNLFIGTYYGTFLKSLVDKYGYEYIQQKVIEAQEAGHENNE